MVATPLIPTKTACPNLPNWLATIDIHIPNLGDCYGEVEAQYLNERRRVTAAEEEEPGATPSRESPFQEELPTYDEDDIDIPAFLRRR